MRLLAPRRRSPGILVLVAVLGGCARPEPGPLDRSESSLVDLLPDSEEVQGRFAADAGELELGDERLAVVRQFAPSRLSFPMPALGAGAELRLAVALDPRKAARSDGARVEVRCSAAGAERRLLASDLAAAAATRWQEVRIGLAPCLETGRLVLEAACGPARNCRSDAVVWGAPRVLRPRRFETAVPKLVLLVSIDTLRADRAAAAPQLRRLAGDGVEFATAVAHSSWTLPSHTTLFASVRPSAHRTLGVTPVPERLPLLAERFRAAGFQTAAFVDAAWLDPRYGIGRGFDLYDYRPVGTEARRGAARGLARLAEWLRAAPERPAFVFWHLMDVHGPYGAPAPFGGSRGRSDPATPLEPPLAAAKGVRLYDHLGLGRFRTAADVAAAYDEGVAAADAAVGALLDGLRRAGLYDDAVVAIVADHGETLFEHGGWHTHGLLLAESEIRVPWILKLPGRRHAGRRVTEMVRLVDVAPTLLEAAGLEPPDSFRGRSLLAALDGREGFPRVASGWSDNTGAFYVRTARWKLVTAATRPAEEIAAVFLRSDHGVPDWLPGLLVEQLYDLEDDPGERRNRITDAPPELVAELRELAARHIARGARLALELGDEGAPVEIPAEERARLRALGYLQ